jgi:hypothetical protein
MWLDNVLLPPISGRKDLTSCHKNKIQQRSIDNDSRKYRGNPKSNIADYLRSFQPLRGDDEQCYKGGAVDGRSYKSKISEREVVIAKVRARQGILDRGPYRSQYFADFR